MLEEARKQPFDVLLLDLNYARDTTSGGEGLDLLNGLRASGVHAPVVVMTAWGSVDLAVEAMRRGAIDFVQKPWDNDASAGHDRTGTDSRAKARLHRRAPHAADVARSIRHLHSRSRLCRSLLPSETSAATHMTSSISVTAARRSAG